MVITNIAVTKSSKQVILSADITFRGKQTQRAYIKVSKAYEDFVYNDASPFLAAVLLPCMKTRENIYVDGSISEVLLKNTIDIMTLVKKWNIGMYKIKIRSKKISKDTKNPKYIGAFFTAGVDSFYTYLKHKDRNDKPSHLILVHGFDIPLNNKIFFKEVKNTVEKVAKEEKIKSIIVETNLGEIVEKLLIWDFAHGGALAAVALFLRANVKQVYIPGAVKNDQLFPYGTHPELDKLWSTRILTVRSDGGEYDRIEKVTKVIAKSPLALKYLRVCTQNLKGKYNCSRCYKCLITMIYLSCADALKKAYTFDRTLNVELVKKMYYDYKLKYNIQGEMALAMLKKQHQNPQLQEAIAYSLEKSKNPRLTKRIYQIIALWDQRHNNRRLYQFVFQMNNKGDRNMLFKLLLNKGILK